MLVHLARLTDERLNASADRMRELAERDRHRRHRLTDDPSEADVILFTQCHLLGDDWTLSAIRRSETYSAFQSKSLVYDERDNPWCVLPGVYVSMPARWLRHDLQRPWAYYSVDFDRQAADPDLLFSFAGSPTASCREPLFALEHTRGVVERASGFTFYDPSSANFDERKRRYVELVSRSRFVLCPRGVGTSSIRLYEVMAAGRVPVIIADDWVEPSGPDWSAFSIRWPENRPGDLLAHLESRESEWAAMALAGRAAFDQYFAPEVSFHNIAEQCAEVLPRTGEAPRFSDRLGRAGGFISAGARLARTRARVKAGAVKRKVRQA